MCMYVLCEIFNELNVIGQYNVNNHTVCICIYFNLLSINGTIL